MLPSIFCKLTYFAEMILITIVHSFSARLNDHALQIERPQSLSTSITQFFDYSEIRANKRSAFGNIQIYVRSRENRHSGSDNFWWLGDILLTTKLGLHTTDSHLLCLFISYYFLFSLKQQMVSLIVVTHLDLFQQKNQMIAKIYSREITMQFLLSLMEN